MGFKGALTSYSADAVAAGKLTRSEGVYVSGEGFEQVLDSSTLDEGGPARWICYVARYYNLSSRVIVIEVHVDSAT